MHGEVARLAKKELRKSKEAKKSAHSSAQPDHEVRIHRSEMLEPGFEPGSQLYQAGVLTAVGLLLILENTALQSGIRSFLMYSCKTSSPFVNC